MMKRLLDISINSILACSTVIWPMMIGIIIPAMVPNAVLIPTRTLAYLGAKSKWLICQPKVNYITQINSIQGLYTPKNTGLILK